MALNSVNKRRIQVRKHLNPTNQNKPIVEAYMTAYNIDQLRLILKALDKNYFQYVGLVSFHKNSFEKIYISLQVIEDSLMHDSIPSSKKDSFFSEKISFALKKIEKALIPTVVLNEEVRRFLKDMEGLRNRMREQF